MIEEYRDIDDVKQSAYKIIKNIGKSAPCWGIPCDKCIFSRENLITHSCDCSENIIRLAGKYLDSKNKDMRIDMIELASILIAEIKYGYSTKVINLEEE